MRRLGWLGIILTLGLSAPLWAADPWNLVGPPFPRPHLFDGCADKFAALADELRAHANAQGTGLGVPPTQLEEYLNRLVRAKHLTGEAKLREGEYGVAKLMLREAIELKLFQEPVSKRRAWFQARAKQFRDTWEKGQDEQRVRDTVPFLTVVFEENPPLTLQAAQRLERICLLRFLLAQITLSNSVQFVKQLGTVPPSAVVYDVLLDSLEEILGRSVKLVAQANKVPIAAVLVGAEPYLAAIQDAYRNDHWLTGPDYNPDAFVISFSARTTAPQYVRDEFARNVNARSRYMVPWDVFLVAYSAELDLYFPAPK